jgi:hypothetical protein
MNANSFASFTNLTEISGGRSAIMGRISRYTGLTQEQEILSSIVALKNPLVKKELTPI